MKVSAGSQAEVAAASAAETLARTGRLRFRSNGTSMLPCLRPGDVLDFVSTDGPIEHGDIVLWRRADRLFVHRVVAKDHTHVRTRGDSMLHPDPPVPAAEVLGRLKSYERAGRRRPSPRLRVMDHCWSWCLRRSSSATRMFLRWHRLSERLRA